MCGSYICGVKTVWESGLYMSMDCSVRDECGFILWCGFPCQDGLKSLESKLNERDQGIERLTEEKLRPRMRLSEASARLNMIK